MASPEVRGHFRDSMELFNYGFAKYAYESFFAPDSVCGVVKVGKGAQETVEGIVAKEAGSIYLKGEQDKLTSSKEMLSYINAPVQKGQKLGEVHIMKDGNLQSKVDIVAAQDVDKGGYLKQIRKTFAETFTL